MSETQAISFSCPACGKNFRWKQQIVGKQYTCKCGVAIVVPSSAGAAAELVLEVEDEGYDVEVTEVFQPVDAAKGIPTNTISGRLMGIPARRSVFENVHVEHEEWVLPKRPWEIWVAAILAGIGFILTYVDAMYSTGPRVRTFVDVLPMTTVLVVLNWVLVGVAIYLVALFMVDVEMEHPWRIAVKAGAVALVPPALGSFVQSAIGGLNGDILGPFTIVGSYLGLFLLLFRLPIVASLACVFVIFVVRVVVQYSLYKLEGAKSSAWI